MENYFKDCRTIEEAKKAYRELLLKHHPDHAGKEGEAETVEIIRQFSLFIDRIVAGSFEDYYADREDKPNADAVTPFQEILKKIIDLDCDIEIIGYWIYCFNSKEVKDILKELGFWYSGKHQAWVFSGRPKKRAASKETLDEIRARKGSQKVCRSGNQEEDKTRQALRITQ